MRSTKTFPTTEWKRWPEACPATTAHGTVRRDDDGRLWELKRATFRVVTVKHFEPVALIDLFNIHREFRATTGGQHA